MRGGENVPARLFETDLLANVVCASMGHARMERVPCTHICLRLKSDGEPGPRQAALTTYYGAFIKDPDGNKIEAVTFRKA